MIISHQKNGKLQHDRLGISGGFNNVWSKHSKRFQILFSILILNYYGKIFNILM